MAGMENRAANVAASTHPTAADIKFLAGAAAGIILSVVLGVGTDLDDWTFATSIFFAPDLDSARSPPANRSSTGEQKEAGRNAGVTAPGTCGRAVR
jgi:hypothetical protein